MYLSGRVFLLSCLQDREEAETAMDVTPSLGGKKDVSTPHVTTPTVAPAEGGSAVRRSISVEGM